MKKLSSYPSSDAAIADLVKEKWFLRYTKAQKTQSIHELEAQYEEIIAHKNMATSEAQNGPDQVGRLNESIGQFLDKHVGDDVGMVARFLLPNSNAQLAIDAATILLPGGLEAKMAETVGTTAIRRLGLRMGVPAVAGALGGATSGNATEGALSGAGQALGGEITSVGLGLGRRGLRNLDFKALIGWLEQRLPVKIPDMPAFYRAFTGGEATKATEGELDKLSSVVEKKINKSSKQTQLGLKNPQLYKMKEDVIAKLDEKKFATTMSQGKSELLANFDDLHKALKTVEQLGWDAKNDTTAGELGKNLRLSAHQIEAEIAYHLDKIDTGLSQDWYTAREKYRTAKTLTNMFSEKDVVDEHNVFNMQKMQELVSDAKNGYKTDIEQSLEPKAQKQLSSILHRNGEEGTRDVQGVGLSKARFNIFSGKPHMYSSLPKFPRHAGLIPYDLGKGLGIKALTTLGPYRFARAVGQFLNQKPSAKATTQGMPSSLPPTTIIGGNKGEEVPAMQINKSPEEMAAMK